MEANIILCKCVKSSRLIGIRIQKMSDGDWWRTWAFKINPKQAQSEGYMESKIQGNLYSTEEYPGCPHCGTQGFVQCHNCGKISCWNGEEALNCGWCGSRLDNIVAATNKFELSGGKF